MCTKISAHKYKFVEPCHLYIIQTDYLKEENSFILIKLSFYKISEIKQNFSSANVINLKTMNTKIVKNILLP